MTPSRYHRTQLFTSSAIQLHALILGTVTSSIQNEPSETQKERVRKFQAVEKAKMRVEKKKRKDVKSGRGRVRFEG